MKIEYGGEVTDDITGIRYYTDTNNIRYISVTTLLSRYEDKTTLDSWRAKVGDKEADKIGEIARTLGKETHSQIESYMEGIANFSLNPYAVAAIDHFYSSVTSIQNEQTVFYQDKDYPELRFAGRTDNLVHIAPNTFHTVKDSYAIPSGNYVVDLKTKKSGLPRTDTCSIILKHLLQGAAYSKGLSLEGIDIEGVIIVYSHHKELKKKPSYTVTKLIWVNRSLLTYYWELFYNLLSDFAGIKKTDLTWQKIISNIDCFYDFELNSISNRLPEEIVMVK